MKFQAPTGATTISRGEDSFTVENGIVDLPQSLGTELGLTAIAADPKGKKDDKGGDKKDPPAADPKGKKDDK